jgi:hypothetical protein
MMQHRSSCPCLILVMIVITEAWVAWRALDFVFSSTFPDSLREQAQLSPAAKSTTPMPTAPACWESCSATTAGTAHDFCCDAMLVLASVQSFFLFLKKKRIRFRISDSELGRESPAMCSCQGDLLDRCVRGLARPSSVHHRCKLGRESPRTF